MEGITDAFSGCRRVQLVLDQGQDNKADICKTRKRGHIWIFFQKEKYWLTNQLKLN
jgi:hypothetical protein